MIAARIPSDLLEPPPFPGATLAVDGFGVIMRGWLGPASPVTACEGDLFAALDVDDAASDAARVQLLLASAIGALAVAWPVLASDAPPVLVRRDGSALIVMWQPIVRGGQIAALGMFVIAGELPRSEADDPTERNRICVDALGLLDECDAGLRHLRGDLSARNAVHRMFRAVHTIKGSTRGGQLRSISDLAHHTEEALDVLRRSDEAAPAGALTQLEHDLRRLRTAIMQARPRGEVDDAMAELSADYRPAVADLRLAAARLARGEREALGLAIRAVDRIADGAERAKLRALRIQCVASRNALGMIGDGHDEDVDPSLLAEVTALGAHVELYTAVYREVSATDSGPSMLVTLSSWMDAPEDRSGTFEGLAGVLAGAGVPSLIEAFADPDPFALRRALAVITDAAAMFEPARPRDDASLRFERAQRDLLAALDALAFDVPASRLADVRAIVQRLVWTPLSVIARRLLRMTRTLGAELGKNVAAEIDLGDLLVAPEIGRVIGEILVHAIRNAADHGIEPPGDRAVAGKDAAGTIRVQARDAGGRLVVTVRDDGRGIDVAKVRRTAVARNLVAADASDAEVIDVLFTPGFSTASAVTAVSGRGVGMDVIKSLAEEQGGTVALTSTPGRGTELVLELPFAPP